MRGTRGIAWALALAAGASLPAFAVEPGARWFTLETEHFRVHFHEGRGMEALAQRVARTSEAAHALLSPRLRWTPARKTDVILSDDVDSANGSAFTLYRPWMRLLAEVPDDQSVLNDYDDPLWNLIVHEYTHVLHLDTIGGLPAAVDAVLGKVLIPNAYVPRWLTEGLATYEESNLSNAGRVRSSLFGMWLRTSVLERPFSIDEVSHSPQEWPRGNLAYLYGGDFLSYVAAQVGEESLPKFFETYGRRLVPFTLNQASREVWQRSFIDLYAAWLNDARARFEAQLEPVRRAGVTPYRVLTSSGYSTEQPHLTRDGAHVVYIDNAPDRRATLRMMRSDGTGDRQVAVLWTTGAMALSPDDARVAIALGDIYREYYVYEDLYEVELRSGRIERLTRGLRATEPAYSPDGKSIAFVGRRGAGETYLALMDRASGSTRTLIEAPFDERIYTPVFSPDGRGVVFSQQSGPGRRLVWLELDSCQPRELKPADAFRLQPAFLDERTLLYASDRTGIYNLHALDLATGEERQVTNVETGAFTPSASSAGRNVAFTAYSARGYDIAVAQMDDLFQGALPAKPSRPPPAYEDPEAAPLAVRRYRPLESIAPLYWLPILGFDSRGAAVGAVTGGADILERHRYSLQASYGLVSHEPAFGASYGNGTFYPGIEAFAQTFTTQAAGFPAGYIDRQWAAGLGTTFPFSSFERSFAIGLGYEFRLFDPQYVPRWEPDSLSPPAPRKGTISVATLSLRFSNARGYADSISAEEGHAVSLVGRHSSRWTGGTFEFSSAEARYLTFLRMPWLRHHVLALQLWGGVAVGDLGTRAVYGLGGIGIDDPVMQVLRGQRVGPGALRGYPQGAISGNAFGLGTLEYRFPVVTVDAGPDTIPLFLRRVHGAVFADVGVTAREPFDFGDPRPGLGVEARVDLTLGYALSTTVRLGLARGLGEGGITQPFLSLGSSF